MKVAIIGRTEMLLEAARRLASTGHTIGLVATCRESGHELAGAKDFADFAAAQGAPFVLGPRLDTPETRVIISAAGCAVAISMNWLTLIPRHVRELFPLGVFNAHPGDLPRFKGNACPNWAILLGENQIVLTLHQMVDALDAGPIALKKRMPLTDESTIADVYEWLRGSIPSAYVEMLDRMEKGNMALEEQPADPSLGLRCYPRRPEDGHINWHASAVAIDRLVRASGRPFPGAFTTLEGKARLTIWRARVEPDAEPFVSAPGQIARARDGDPVICCGEGYLRLIDVSLEGRPGAQEAKAAILSSLRNRLL